MKVWELMAAIQHLPANYDVTIVGDPITGAREIEKVEEPDGDINCVNLVIGREDI